MGKQKLSQEDVKKIRQMGKTKSYSYNDIAQEFNVSIGHVENILKGKKRVQR